MNLWTVSDCQMKLEAMQAKGKISQWLLESKDLKRQELYLLQETSGELGLDQSRQVNQKECFASVWVKKSDNKQGSARQQLFLRQELETQLAKLMEEAQLSTEEAWSFPEEFQVSQGPSDTLSGNRPLGKTCEALTGKLQQAVASANGEFNSAELFVTSESQQNWLSNGGEWQSERSRIYSEVCFSQTDPSSKKSDEYLLTQSACAPEQIDFIEMCEASCNNAREMLSVESTPSGVYSVLISSDVIAQLLNDVCWQLNASRKYMNMPFLKEGSELIKNFSGSPFKWWLDPQLKDAMASCERDSYGRIQQPLLLVEGNKVQNNMYSDRMAQYLDHPPTSSLGNMVVEADGVSLDELRKSDTKVLEIVQFSGLFSNPQSLTYSSEVRLGRLYDNESGKVVPVKGGNLSGNFMENFAGVKWSSENTMENFYDTFAPLVTAYKGPKYALLSKVKVSG